MKKSNVSIKYRRGNTHWREWEYLVLKKGLEIYLISPNMKTRKKVVDFLSEVTQRSTRAVDVKLSAIAKEY